MSIGAVLFATACFSPNVSDEDGGLGVATESTTTAADSRTGGSATSESDAVTTTAPIPTSGTTTGPTRDTEETASLTTSEATAEPTGEDSRGPGPDPFCGDGNVDKGEDCDDGVENNGLDQSCLPDCNLNVCGDGNVGPEEACDDGEDDNVLVVGACAPDCSTVVEEKLISVGSFLAGGTLGQNPVATADGTCDAGRLAMFAVPGQREAAQAPFNSEDGTDWVLHPWTYYVNFSGEVVWATDATALLGVRSGVQEDLGAAIVSESSQTLFDFQILTGLNPDWTTSNANTCNGWTSSSETAMARFGEADTTDMPDMIHSFLGNCSDWSTSTNPPVVIWTDATGFYCVEQ